MNVNTNALSAAAALLAAAVSLTTSSLALAAGPAQDEVDLLDGSTLHGKVTQQVPGSYVVIETDDGHVESVPWSQIKRVSASAAPPTPVPAPASPASGSPPATATAASASAHSPEPPTSPVDREPELHFELGARVGYAFASGDYVAGAPIGNASIDGGVPAIRGGIPVTFDLGMRLGKYVYLGGFVSYASLSTTSPQPPPGYTIHSDGHDVRGGIDAQIHFIPRGKVDPWVGFGFGHEWLTVAMSATASDGTSATNQQTLDGWNFGDVMLGLDLRVAEGLALGPYLEFTSGSFGSESVSQTGGGSTQSGSVDISSTSPHQWFTLGVRGTFEAL